MHPKKVPTAVQYWAQYCNDYNDYFLWFTGHVASVSIFITTTPGQVLLKLLGDLIGFYLGAYIGVYLGTNSDV